MKNFIVKIGFDTKRKRYEIGDKIPGGELTKKEIVALLEMEAIEVTE